MLRFAEELIVLTVGAEKQAPIHIPPSTLDYALAGAVLLDLALENRIDTDADALHVIDPTPVGDSLLDPALADIVQKANTQPTETWLARIAKQGDDLQELALERLVAADILEADDVGVFSLSRWVTHSRSYPAGSKGMMEREIRSRIAGVLLSDDIPSPRDSIIISLAHACGVLRRMFTHSEYEEVKARIELISGLEMVARSVTDAVRNVSLAESSMLARVIRERGGGWPVASGRLPVVGHLFKLIGDLSTFCTEQYLRHGPVFEVRVPGRRLVVMAGQEANLFMNKQGRAHLRTHELWREFSHSVGAAGVLIGYDGADHRLLRRTQRHGISRAFILKQLPEVVAIMERELAVSPFDRPLGVVHFMQRVMTEQLVRLAAGASAREHLDDLVAFTDAMHLVFLSRRYPKFVLRLPRMKRARRRLEALIERVLVEHESGGDTERPRDQIDDLIELHRSAPDFMPETDMFINAMASFMVGLDTSSTATSFAIYALLKHPELLDRVRAEADELFAAGDPTEEALGRMTVTQRVVMETLRRYPIAHVLTRTVTNSFDFAGYRIPAGTWLLIANSVTHKLPEFFPDPERFDIERYSPERREHLQPGVYAPFGLGHHACLGRGFAEVQMVLTLATLLRRVDIALAPATYRLKIRYSPVPKPDGNFKILLRQRP